MTASQRREEARQAHEQWFAECPTHHVLTAVSSRWAGLVLSALRDGPQRHAELQRDIASASPKMLTQTLRQLERDGLVSRTVTAGVPVRVDYALTPLGEDLAPLLASLRDWADRRFPDVQAARRAYDARRAGPDPSS